MARRNFRVTGTNNSSKQVSADYVNDLAGCIERGLDTTPEDFGAVGDDVTNDGPAFAAAIAWLRTNSSSYSDAYYKGSARLRIPAKKYYLGATTLDINHTLIIQGEGTGQDGGIPTQLRWAAGTTGIRVHNYNTAGATGADAGGQQAASGTVIRGLFLRGGHTSAEGEFHGIHLRARAVIEDCYVLGFQGDGVYINCTAGAGDGSNEGNANLWQMNRVSTFGNRNGFYVNGADANAGVAIACNAQNNRQWGIWDSSFLGNTWLGPHLSDNGLVVGSTPTIVSHNGNRYCVNAGQAAGASTNAPSGTSADNTWWLYLGVGAVSTANNIPAWSSGISVREGGAWLADDANQIYGQFINVYSEGGQGKPQNVGSAALVIGGAAPSGNHFRYESGFYRVNDFRCTYMENGGQSLFGDKLTITNADANKAQFQVKNGTNTATFYFSGFGAGLEAFDGSNPQPIYFGGSQLRFYHNGSTLIADIDSTGLGLSAGKVLKIAGTQVVGARAAALPADATDLATAITLVNAIKARMKATGGHGLVAD